MPAATSNRAAVLAALPLAAVSLKHRKALEAARPGWQPLPHQIPPDGDWRTWALVAGRGAGKTRAGAEWAIARIASGRCRRLALVAATAADARDVMVEGESGIMACAPSNARPLYEPSKRRLTWPNGAQATTYSADEPDRLRGPEHDGAWADELAAWRFPEAWDMLLLGLRLGADPRVVVTTTPRPTKLVRDILAAPTTLVTRASTYANRANLAPQFLDQVLARYQGTRLGRQEIEGELIEDVEGALWTHTRLDANRVKVAPDLARVVVAVDPSGGSTEEHDEQGIVVVGAGVDGHGYVLADRSCRLSPDGWARRAIAAYETFHADRIVYEANYGGEMVRSTIATTARTMGLTVALKEVHASRGKQVRAEPVAALDEQCVAGGTFVETAAGPMPIEQITRGDSVWTRDGLRRVLWSGCTGTRPTVRLAMTHGSLLCTPDHPVYVCGRGFVQAALLVPQADILQTCIQSTHASSVALTCGSPADAAGHVRNGCDGARLVNQSARSLSSTGSSTTTKRTAIGERVGIPAINFFTARSGNPQTGLSRRAGTFITSTRIRQTIASPISSRWTNGITPLNMQTTLRSQRLLSKSDFPASAARGGPSVSPSQGFARGVGRTSRPPALVCNSVGRPVLGRQVITAVEPGPTLPVFNLSVEGTPEFFANGVLVHNCKLHMVGSLPELEDQLCVWEPGSGQSPDRLDALVWACTDLLLNAGRTGFF